jgi:hypothetical protein
MQRISYSVLAISLYFILSGCGLVAFPTMDIPKDNQQTTPKNQQDIQKNMLRSSDKFSNQSTKSVDMVMKKNDKTYVHTIQEKIITVINQEKQKTPVKIVVPIEVDPAPKTPDKDPTPIPTNPAKDDPFPQEEEENPQPDEKYQAALKKAEELKGTNQQVTADQGNVYENPEEKSTIIQTILKDQKLHIDNTKVDQDDAEIWCLVSGNDGQKDIIGWISYQIIEQK